MGRRTVEIAESAFRDLEDILRWYVDQGVREIGERYVEELLQHIDVLELHPDLGRTVPEFGQAALRELIHPPFRIVYRREVGTVRVLRIWRSERRLVLPP